MQISSEKRFKVNLQRDFLLSRDSRQTRNYAKPNIWNTNLYKLLKENDCD